MIRMQQGSVTNGVDDKTLSYTFIAESDEIFDTDGTAKIIGQENDFLFAPDTSETYYWSKSQGTWKPLGWKNS